MSEAGSLARAWRALATGGCFFFFWMGGAVLGWVILPLARIVARRRPAIERTRLCQRIVSRAFVLFHDCMRWLRLLRFDPRQVRAAAPPGPFLLVANHPTLVDVTALIAVYPHLCCVAKAALHRGPLVGRLLRDCGHLAASGAPWATMGPSVLEQAMARLAAGLPVLVFPEGTRSPAGGLRRFRRGAFEIARRAGVPIQPVAIACDPPTLTKGVPWWAHPKRTATLSLTPLSPWPAPAADADVRVLAAQVREAIARNLAARPAGAEARCGEAVA